MAIFVMNTFLSAVAGTFVRNLSFRFLKASKDRRPNWTSLERTVRLGEFFPSQYLYMAFRFLAL